MAIAHIRMHRRWFAGLVGLAVLMGSFVPQQSFAQSIDYDADDDGLIEVDSLVKLNAIRYDLDGNGVENTATSIYTAAFPTPAPSMGCPATCTGYELMANLDFDTSGDDEITAADGVLSWGEGADAGRGWQPIGTSSNLFTAEFHGNGHTISHLFIDRTNISNYFGLFGYIASEATIRSVGLVEANVTGRDNIGSLVGVSEGTIERAYATGEVSGISHVGGLVGNNLGQIRASYATGMVSGNNFVGGLVGSNFTTGIINASYAVGDVSAVGSINEVVGGLTGLNRGTIRASYATGAVSGVVTSVGGLFGLNTGSIDDSYFDSDTSGQTGSEGTSTAVLQLPTSYTSTGIYANWNLDLDGDSTIDDPWDFGTNEQYPVLQMDFNGDGVKSWEEFGLQSRPGVLVFPVELSLTEVTTETYTVVLLTTPTESVTVTPGSENPAVSVSDLLTFMIGNWDMEQTVTVHAVDDGNTVSEMVSLTHAVTSDDPNYNSATVRDVMVSVTDNGAGIVVSSEGLSLMEGEAGSYTVVLLSAPTNDSVTVRPMSRNTTSVSVSGELIFTMDNWNMEQTVTASAVYDMNTANEVVVLTHAVDSTDSDYISATASNVMVNVTDNGAGIVVSRAVLPLMEGTTGTYTAALLSPPTAMVTVTPVSPRTETVSVSGALTFMPDDWSTTQTVTVRAENDANTDNEMVLLTHTVASTDPNYNTQVIAPAVTVDVTDDDGGIRVRVRVFLEGPLR